MTFNPGTMTVTTRHKLVEKSCYSCEFPFLAPEWFEKQCLERGREWFCPACGKSTVYMESEVNKLKRELKDQVSFWQNQYQSEQRRHETTEARRRAAAGQITKLKKRVSHGVCPCCNRTFQNLQRHMKTQHPEFATTCHD